MDLFKNPGGSINGGIPPARWEGFFWGNLPILKWRTGGTTTLGHRKISLVGGDWLPSILNFPIYYKGFMSNHPNWRSPSFFINFIVPLILGLCHHPVIDELHHFSEGFFPGPPTRYGSEQVSSELVLLAWPFWFEDKAPGCIVLPQVAAGRRRMDGRSSWRLTIMLLMTIMNIVFIGDRTIIDPPFSGGFDGLEYI